MQNPQIDDELMLDDFARQGAQTQQRETGARDALEFLAQLPGDTPTHLIIVGGLPRSGTSSCDRFLHAHSGCFMTDEHHSLLNEQILSGYEYLVDYQNSEIALWKSDAGRSWRNYKLTELDWARRRWLLSLLFLHTRREKFAGKFPERVAVIGVKLPHIENTVPRIVPLVAPCPVTFVYCVREPTLVLSSNWEMPWVSSSDARMFADNMLQQYASSLAAFRTVRKTNIKTVIWRTPDTAGDDGASRQTFLSELDLVTQLGSHQDTAIPVVDEWPRERRRRVAPIGDAVLKAFSESDAVQEFRREFELPSPCL